MILSLAPRPQGDEQNADIPASNGNCHNDVMCVVLAWWITSADDMITAFESIFTPRFHFIS